MEDMNYAEKQFLDDFADIKSMVLREKQGLSDPKLFTHINWAETPWTPYCSEMTIFDDEENFALGDYVPIMHNRAVKEIFDTIAHDKILAVRVTVKDGDIEQSAILNISNFDKEMGFFIGRQSLIMFGTGSFKMYEKPFEYNDKNNIEYKISIAYLSMI